MTFKSAHGFTLVELLIAVIVLAIISTMAYSGLSSVLKSHDILSKQQETFGRINQMVNQLQREIRTIVPRPIHDKYNTLVPAIKLESGSMIIFSFTRAGIANPAGLQKNSLQRIDYIFNNKVLRKRTWLVVDNNNIEDYNEEIIAQDLKQFRIDLLGFNNAWYQQWPTNRNDPADLLPKAIKFTFALPETGEISRLLELPL